MSEAVDDRFPSWGLYPSAPPARAYPIAWRDDPLPPTALAPMLPYGLGRSYGDSCLNGGGTVLPTRRLSHLIDFDDRSGLLVAEAGVSLGEILAFAVPRGWFLPVSPGTKHVTLGGAIANDIHGKNHHRVGSFGRHVAAFELLRSDGRRLRCTPGAAGEAGELFSATVGGLGLTGLILLAELRLQRIESPWIDAETIRFARLDEFFELAATSDASFEYTVAWIDSLVGGDALGRGHFIRGNHAPAGGGGPAAPSRRVSVPFHAPGFALSRWNLRLFNSLYFHRQRRRVRPARVHHEPFFYPLDAVEHWNRLYGRRGFLQYQSVVPTAAGAEATRRMLRTIVGAGDGSFLAVLKLFGDLPSPGLLSFPMPGVTLALDFPNRGRRTLRLLDELDAIVLDHGGRVYPAKDARMSAGSFRTFYPRLEQFRRHVDPAFSSTFWRRVGDEAGR